MNKEEFFSELEESLQGEVSDREFRDSVDYYRGYFLEQEALGRTEEDILNELGSARYIAHSIIDAHGLDRDRSHVDSAYDREEAFRETGGEVVNDPEPSPVDHALSRVGSTLALIGGLLLLGVVLRFMLPFILVIIAVIIIARWIG